MARGMEKTERARGGHQPIPTRPRCATLRPVTLGSSHRRSSPGAVKDATCIRSVRSEAYEEATLCTQCTGWAAQLNPQRGSEVSTDHIKPVRGGPFPLGERSKQSWCQQRLGRCRSVDMGGPMGERHPRQPPSSVDRSVGVWQPQCHCKSAESQRRWCAESAECCHRKPTEVMGGWGTLSDDQAESAACCRRGTGTGQV
eukprot:349913-Chlamydomonas_euryale.AAC.2